MDRVHPPEVFADIFADHGYIVEIDDDAAYLHTHKSAVLRETPTGLQEDGPESAPLTAAQLRTIYSLALDGCSEPYARTEQWIETYRKKVENRALGD